MKRFLCCTCAAVLISSMLFMGGCKDPNGGGDIVVQIYTPKPTDISTPVPTVVVDVTIEPTATVGVTIEPTAAVGVTTEPTVEPTLVAPTATPTDAPDYTVFDDAAFLGNSTFEGLYRYGIITNGRFFTRVGLNVLTVHTATTTNGSVPVIDELNTGTYNKVLLMFGENELGWPSPASFIQKYSELLDAVWQRQPNCKIYIVGMPPVSAAVSSSSTTGVTNENIRTFNTLLEELANERGCEFIDVPDELVNSEGVLPAEASSDGIHLNLQYARYWADHICLTVMGVYN